MVQFFDQLQKLFKRLKTDQKIKCEFVIVNQEEESKGMIIIIIIIIIIIRADCSYTHGGTGSSS